jgi:hypothetical protein
MPTIEGVCGCKCEKCKAGNHCGILDNDCLGTSNRLNIDKPMTDEEMLREDEIRAATGLFDFNSLGGNSLSPFEDDTDADPEDDGDEDEHT